jgi:DNA-binding NarL/FixJ family response regulator
MMNIQPRRRRVVIVDDHTLFRDGLRTILSMEDDFEVIADVESAEDIVELMWETKPDVLLLDIRMPQGSGLDAVPAVCRISPNTTVIVLTACDEMEEHVRAFKLGARGVVLKDSAAGTLVQAIRSVCRGETWMDPRMRGVLVAELARSGDDSSEASRSTATTASPTASSRSCAWSPPARRTRRSPSSSRSASAPSAPI